jgi:hypothetical protein
MVIAMRPSGEGARPIEYGNNITPQNRGLRPISRAEGSQNLAQPDTSSECLGILLIDLLRSSNRSAAR